MMSFARLLTRSGLTNKEIARALRKSELTVRDQLAAVYRKLGLKRRLQIIAQFRG